MMSVRIQYLLAKVTNYCHIVNAHGVALDIVLGKRDVSLISSTFIIHLIKRSIPSPNPPCGTDPYFLSSRYHLYACGFNPSFSILFVMEVIFSSLNPPLIISPKPLGASISAASPIPLL